MDQDPVYKKVLNRCLRSLIDDLDIQSMIDYIITKEILPQSKTDDIKDENYRTEKKRKLIESVAAAGEDAYKIFLEGLKETKQKHLWEKLKRIEKEETEKAKACAESGTPGAAETLTSTMAGLVLQASSDTTQDRNKEASGTKDTDNGQPFEPNDQEEAETSGAGTIQGTNPPTESGAGFKDIQEGKSDSSLASVDKANNSNSQAAPRESAKNTTYDGSGEASVPNAEKPDLLSMVS